MRRSSRLAVGETVILLHPPLPLVLVSIWMERERQQNDSLANGYMRLKLRDLTLQTSCDKCSLSLFAYDER